MIYKVFTEDSINCNTIDPSTYSDLCIIEMNSVILDLSNNMNYVIESSNLLDESGVIDKAKQIITKILDAIKKFFSKVKEFFTKGKIKNSANKLKETRRKNKSKRLSNLHEPINVELSMYPVDPFELRLNSQFIKDLENLRHTIDDSIDAIFISNSDGEMYDKKHYEDFKKICDTIMDNAKEGSREVELYYADLEKISSDRLIAEVDKISDSITKIGDDMYKRVENLSKDNTNKDLISAALRVNLYTQDVLIYLQKVIAVVGGIGSELILDIASAYGKFVE